MNKKKVSFIICTNHDQYFRECKEYIQNLIIPTGYSTEVVPITNATSMCAGYNQGIRESDAKYKVYLHQDVFILNRNFLSDTLKIFAANDRIGMLGMVGTKRLPDNGCMWTTPMRTGALRSCVLNTVDDYFDLPISKTRGSAPVQAVDGLLIMTQYDLPWREDLKLGWDFYDISQSLEFINAGYRIVVPYQDTPWVLHDNGFLHLGGYHKARKSFLQEYYPERITEIKDCEQAIMHAHERKMKLLPVTEAKQQILADIAQARYSQAAIFAQTHLEEYQEDEEYCILCLLAGIDESERAANISKHLFSLIRPDMEWITSFYHKIKFCLWRLENPFSSDIQYEAQKYLTGHLSKLAIQRLREFIKVS